MAFDEIIGDLIGEVLIPGLLKLVRLPGALLSWAIWRRRTWRQVWNEGNWFGQSLTGLAIHIVWITVLIAS